MQQMPRWKVIILAALAVVAWGTVSTMEYNDLVKLNACLNCRLTPLVGTTRMSTIGRVQSVE